MYKRILAPLDGSTLGELILPYVAELGERFDSQIILLRVYSPKSSSIFHEYEAYVQQVAKTIKEQLGEKAKVEPITLSGKANREIIDYSKKENINLIAMVTHGKFGIRRWLLGSTADKIIRETSKPVLLIRAGTLLATREKGIMNNILTPLDGSKLGESILPHVETLATETPTKVIPEITLLQVVPSAYYIPTGRTVTQVSYSNAEIEQLKTKANNYLEEIRNRLKSKQITAKCEIAVGDAAEKITEIASKINANLIVMSTHGYSGFSRLFLGSTTDRVLHHGNTPLLLVKPAEARETTH
ncbi:MAG: universal stress protein [Dehalococcoidia bacterium]|nr:universal stress protein [Dehalococcoidia bacterium]